MITEKLTLGLTETSGEPDINSNSGSRGRARSRSFRSEDEESMQRGIVPDDLNTNSNAEMKGKASDPSSRVNLHSLRKKSSSDPSSPLGKNDRRDSDERLVVNSSKSSAPESKIQIRDSNGLSQKTLNSVRNIQDPYKSHLQETRIKTEAEIAEEELLKQKAKHQANINNQNQNQNNLMLSKGFLTTQQYDYYIKILLLGDSGVGKTSLMLRFADNEFRETLIGTAGVDFKVRYLENKQGIKTKCQIWDTAGQEKFHVITRSYYAGAHGIALVYDASDMNTFKKIGYWMDNIKNHATKDVFLVLLANKVDLPKQEVTHEQGKAIAEAHGYQFFETSAKTGKNVVEAFQTVSDLAVDQLRRKAAEKEALQNNAQMGGNNQQIQLRAQQKNIIQGSKGSGCCLIQ